MNPREFGLFVELERNISEELKHTNLLNTMIRRRNGIVAED